MPESTSLWRRLSSMVRGPGADGAPLKLPETRAAPWWRPGARREQAREVAQRFALLAESLEEHFRRQDQRSAALSGSLDRVGGMLEQLAAAQRAQADYLRTIADHTETANKNSGAIASSLARLPDSLTAQAEAIRTVARHLEVAQETDTQLMHSLQQFGRAVDTLGASGTAQVEVLQRLNTAQQNQNQTMTTLVREQSRKALTVLIILGVLALGAIALAAVTLLVRGAA